MKFKSQKKFRKDRLITTFLICALGVICFKSISKNPNIAHFDQNADPNEIDVDFFMDEDQVSFGEGGSNNSFSKSMFKKTVEFALDSKFLVSKKDYSSLVIPVKKGSETAYLLKKGLKSKYKMPTKVGKIKLIDFIDASYFDNPLNVFVVIPTIAEGNGDLLNDVLLFAPKTMTHFDPGKNLGRFKFNLGPLSSQHSDKTGAHERVFSLTGGSESLESRIKVFQSGEYINPAKEYSKDSMSKYILRSWIAKNETNLPAVNNLVDIIVQLGPGLADDFDKNYQKVDKWTPQQVQNYFVQNGLGTQSAIDSKLFEGGVNQFPIEVQRVLVARCMIFMKNPKKWGGLRDIAQKNGITFAQQVFHDQTRRMYDMRHSYSNNG
ncbi:MAG: hypothetical protein ACRCXZ_05880, partial [Patescibacteria group bacterium]